MALNSSCRQDSDCGVNEFCYAGTTWFESQLQDASNLTDVFGCDCNSFYAWEGQNCDQISASTVVTVIINIINSLFHFCSILGLIFVLKVHWEKDGTFKTHPGTVTALLNLLAAFGLLLWHLTTGIASGLSTSGDFPGSRYLKTDPYRGRYNHIGFAGAVIGYLFVNFSAIVVSMLWVEVSDLINNHDNKKKYRKFVVVYLLAYMLSVGSVVFIERKLGQGIDLKGFAAIPCQLVLLVTYSIGSRQFTVLLQQASDPKPSKSSVMSALDETREVSSSNDYSESTSRTNGSSSNPNGSYRRTRTYRGGIQGQWRKIATRVRNIAIAMVFALGCQMGSGFLFSILQIAHKQGDVSGFRETVYPGHYWGISKILYLMNASTLTAIVVIITVYLYGNSRQQL